MHEVALVEALIEQVAEQVHRSGCSGRVVGVDLVVGRLCGAHADSIRFAFEMLAPGTLVEAAQLRIAEPKATCRCHTCGWQAEIDDLTAACIRCGSRDVSIHGGQELLLQSIDVDDE